MKKLFFGGVHPDYNKEMSTRDTALKTVVPDRVVIPMHYRSDTFGFQVIGTVEEFTALCGNVVRCAENSLELTADTPAQTAVLTYHAP